MTISNFVPERLVEARRARGMTATELADKINRTPVSVSNYENGRQTPRLDVLASLAEALAFPRAYFLRPASSDEQGEVFWRARLSAPKYRREQAGVRLVWFREILAYLERYFDFPELNLPAIEVPEDPRKLSFEACDAIADEIRRQWGVSPGPFPNVIETLEGNGIFVSRISVNAEKLDAFSQWDRDRNTPLVVLGRDKASAVRQRFDALHELAHMVVHRHVDRKLLKNRDIYQLTERQADRIASSILLPEKEFLSELPSITLDGFLSIKERWGVSVGAMMVRAGTLDLVPDEFLKRMWMNYARRGWRKSEPLDPKIPKERPNLIRMSIEMLVEEGVQTASDIRRELPFPISDLEELADLETGTLNPAVPAKPAHPMLKQEFRASEGSNVVSLFQDE